jgi:hypothetical protein
MSKIKAKSFELFKIFFIFLPKTLLFEKQLIVKKLYIKNKINLSISYIIGVNETTNLLGQVWGL